MSANSRAFGRAYDDARRLTASDPSSCIPRDTRRPRSRYARESVKWVADHRGHADPSLTLLLLQSSKADRRNLLIGMARREGFEPPTPRFEAWCSIQLSYRREPQQ